MTKRATKKSQEPEPAPAQLNRSKEHSLDAWLTPKWRVILGILVIVAAGLWVFSPALWGYWIWDDTMLVVNNPDLRDLTGLKNIWFTTPYTDYWPGTFTTLWVEWHLFGNNPLGYHVVNLLLHLMSALLIWRLFRVLKLPWAYIGALLFVIHPLAVESVAWVSEIKNTLSLPFFLLALLSYIDEDNRKRSLHIPSFLFFLAALLCKTSTIMLPGTLLLYCWWKRGQITWKDFKGTIPFFVAAIIFGILTIHFQSDHNRFDPVVDDRGAISRIIGACVIATFYIVTFIVPVNLMPVYPRSIVDDYRPFLILILPVLAFSVYGLWTARSTWGRLPLFGLAFFLINVLPVLGFVKMAYMNLSWTADHLVYLPMVGLILFVVACLDSTEQCLPRAWKISFRGALAMLFLPLIMESHSCARCWDDQLSLWRHAVTVDPTDAYTHLYYGEALAKSDVSASAAELNTVFALRPTPNDASMARICLEALRLKQEILRNPASAVLHDDLGNVLAQGMQHNLPNAVEEYKAAIQLEPKSAIIHYNLANALLKTQGGIPEAISEYEIATKLKPDFVEAHVNLAYALIHTSGRRQDAIRHLKIALQLKPNSSVAAKLLRDLESSEP